MEAYITTIIVYAVAVILLGFAGLAVALVLIKGGTPDQDDDDYFDRGH